MRWVWFLIVLFLVPQALAITMDCPASAVQNENFNIGVSHSGASQVRANFDGSWHTQNGNSGTWVHRESVVGLFRYWGDAYVDGEWISTGDDLCLVDITSPTVDAPGTVQFTVNPTTIEYGDAVSLSVNFYDDDRTDEIAIYRGPSLIYVGGTTSCSGGSCSFSTTDNPSSTTTYTAVGYDRNRNEYTKTKSVTVTGATVPAVSLVVSPTSLETGASASFFVSATDAGGDLQQIKVFYDDGQSATQTCSGGSCSKT